MSCLEDPKVERARESLRETRYGSELQKLGKPTLPCFGWRSPNLVSKGPRFCWSFHFFQESQGIVNILRDGTLMLFLDHIP